MLSILLLLLLSLCNAKLPLESTGNEKVGSSPKPISQLGYPNDNAFEWVENIPNMNLSHDAYKDDEVSQSGRISNNTNLKIPDMDDRIGVLLEVLEFSENSETADGDENEDIADRKASTRSKQSHRKSNFSKIFGNVTLSKRKSVRDHVTHLVHKARALRKDSDLLINQLNLLYLNLAIDESDNKVTAENSYKYGMSVVLRFLFEFYRIFRKLSFHSTQHKRLHDMDVYGLSFDNAVAVMKEKRGYNPLEISTPVRRSMNFFNGILYESVIIIQTKCTTLHPNWKCIIVYLANLVSETLNCPNVWYHAFIHILALEKIELRDSFVYSIGNLDRFKDFFDFENIFDYIMEKIQEYREVGRIQLSAEAIFFTMLADLQDNGFLNCISIDFLYN